MKKRVVGCLLLLAALTACGRDHITHVTIFRTPSGQLCANIVDGYERNFSWNGYHLSPTYRLKWYDNKGEEHGVLTTGTYCRVGSR